MSQVRRLGIVAALVAVLAALVAGCGSSSGGNSVIIRGTTDQPVSYDPAGAYDLPSYDVIYAIYQNLMTIPAGGMLILTQTGGVGPNVACGLGPDPEGHPGVVVLRERRRPPIAGRQADHLRARTEIRKGVVALLIRDRPGLLRQGRRQAVALGVVQDAVAVSVLEQPDLVVGMFLHLGIVERVARRFRNEEASAII